MDQEKVKFRLNIAEVTKKIDTETSVDNFEIPNQLNAGDKVDVMQFDYRFRKVFLSLCKELTIGGNFPEIAVFAIQKVLTCQT